MAKEFVVLRNGLFVDARVDSKQDAEALCTTLSIQNPRATYEYGKMDKKYYNTYTEESFTPVEEPL